MKGDTGRLLRIHESGPAPERIPVVASTEETFPSCEKECTGTQSPPPAPHPPPKRHTSRLLLFEMDSPSALVERTGNITPQQL